MKNLIFLIIIAACSYHMSGYAQSKSKDVVVVAQPSKPSAYRDLLYKDPVHKQVDTYPIYPGGASALYDFINKNLKTAGESGKVFATFVIEKDGSLSNIEILRSFSEKATAEATRVIRSMPKWKPGMAKGKIVRTQYTIPIQFK